MQYIISHGEVCQEFEGTPEEIIALLAALHELEKIKILGYMWNLTP